MVSVREPAHVAGVAEELGRQHGPHAEDLGQGGRVGLEHAADAPGGRGDLPVQAAHVGQQLAGQVFALPGRRRRGGGAGPAGSRPGPRSAGGRPRPGAGQLAARAGGLRVRVRSATRSSRRSDSSRTITVWSSAVTGRSWWWWRAAAVTDYGRGRVDPVGGAGVAGVQQPGPGGQFGRHVNDRLVGGDQQASSSWAMPRPRPVAPSTAHCRFGQLAARASNWGAVWRVTGRRSWPTRRLWGSRAAAVSERLWGSMPMVINGRPFRRGGRRCPRRAARLQVAQQVGTGL